MELNDIHNLLKKMFDAGIGELKNDIPVDPYIFIEAAQINAVCYFLRDEESLQFDFMSCLSGVDYDNDNQNNNYKRWTVPTCPSLNRALRPLDNHHRIFTNSPKDTWRIPLSTDIFQSY